MGVEPTTKPAPVLNKSHGRTRGRTLAPQSPPDLQEVVAAWATLPDTLKAAVLAVVRTVARGAP